MTSVEEPPVQIVRQWKKFGACANATGPERGITMNCDRRPVEFNWSDMTTRIFAAENTRQMKLEWEMYLGQQVLPKLREKCEKKSEKQLPPNALPSESVAARSEQHSQVGESTSPIASSPLPANSRELDTRSKHTQQSVVKAPALMEHKLGLSGFASTLHTDAAEFIPKANHAPLRTTQQPVQWLNNDVQKLNEHPFRLPDQNNGSPHGQSGEHANNRSFAADTGRSNFYNESREYEANTNTNDEDGEAARRNAQLLNMKAKLKGHYRLLYSKYKEYVAKRVPEKVEEYYIRLKHCQAQYMKLKYYEYKAHAVAQNPRTNSSNPMNGAGGVGPSGASPSPRPGRGGVVPPNNPWQTGQQNVATDSFGGGYGAGGGGGGGGAWADDAKGGWQKAKQQEYQSNEQWREQRDYTGGQGSQGGQGTYAGFGGSMNGNGSMWGDGYSREKLQFARQQRQQAAANGAGGYGQGNGYGQQQSPDVRAAQGYQSQRSQHNPRPQRF